VEAFMPKV